MNPADEIYRHYVIAALWSTPDDKGGNLDDEHDIYDLALPTIAAMRKDCESFYEKAFTLGLIDEYPGNFEQFGHDFWLTRCGHGAGFWDRGLGDLGDKLTELCKEFGEVDIYVGDDGKIWQSGAES